eukprot:TRINITY_DN13296_c0_g1_i1.p1 TRINITY_DN13296_c0_g1~~TRINITY_DN13296_c0_g1_i1.p1  ORF type:complete len:134 (-),score=54.33 TRINITY_DN13296_c0_g1_i1:32-433(-)
MGAVVCCFDEPDEKPQTTLIQVDSERDPFRMSSECCCLEHMPTADGYRGHSVALLTSTDVISPAEKEKIHRQSEKAAAATASLDSYEESYHVQEAEGAGSGVEACLLYTSDAADDLLCVDLGGRRIIKKKNNE